MTSFFSSSFTRNSSWLICLKYRFFQLAGSGSTSSRRYTPLDAWPKTFMEISVARSLVSQAEFSTPKKSLMIIASVYGSSPVEEAPHQTRKSFVPMALDFAQGSATFFIKSKCSLSRIKYVWFVVRILIRSVASLPFGFFSTFSINSL